MARVIQHGRVVFDFYREEDGSVRKVVSGVNPDIVETEGTAFEKAPRNFAFDLSSVQQEVGDNVTVGQIFTGYKNIIKAQANTTD